MHWEGLDACVRQLLYIGGLHVSRALSAARRNGGGNGMPGVRAACGGPVL